MLAVAVCSALLLWQAPGRGEPVDQLPAVLVLISGGEQGIEAAQRAFADELELVLDAFEVRTVELVGEEFAALPLQEQLGRVEPLTAQHEAAATVWVERGSDGSLVLNLVAQSEGRALVRVVEAGPVEAPAAELALAARELLLEAHVLDGAAEPGASAAGDAEEGVAPAEERSMFGVITAFEIGGGLAGHAGPSLRLGGALGFEWWITESLLARVAIAGTAGPRARTHDGVVQGWRIEPGLDVGYVFDLGRVALGPLLGISFSRSALDVALGGGDNESYDWWSMRFAAGLDLRVALTRILAIALDGTAGLYPGREVFERLSDGSTVLRTPRLDWCVLVGVAIRID